MPESDWRVILGFALLWMIGLYLSYRLDSLWSRRDKAGRKKAGTAAEHLQYSRLDKEASMRVTPDDA